MTEPQTIKLGKTEYVIVPRADYVRLRTLAGGNAGAVDAAAYARGSIAKTLKAAREKAGLTQADLAQKLGKSQPMISGAENGKISVSERYVAAVLRACKLPKAWPGNSRIGRLKGRLVTRGDVLSTGEIFDAESVPLAGAARAPRRT